MVLFTNPQSRSRHSHGETLSHEHSLKKLAKIKEKELKKSEEEKILLQHRYYNFSLEDPNYLNKEDTLL